MISATVLLTELAAAGWLPAERLLSGEGMGQCVWGALRGIMTVFLFWNLNRKPLMSVVTSLVQRHRVDVLMLVESPIAPTEMLKTLNPPGRSEYSFSPGILCRKVQIFTRFTAQFIPPLHEADRLTIRHLCLPGRIDILLAVSHFPSKLHWREASQAFECVELAHSIESAEKRLGHSRTVLVGDLNMNPFEDGVVSAMGLHAVMSRRIASKVTRVVQLKEYPFFYNPMWGLFGDTKPGAPGTYYYSSSEHKVFFWNMFDQVLIRPEMIDRFDSEDLRILDSDGSNSFLNDQGLPDSKSYSDHLPILFKLEL